MAKLNEIRDPIHNFVHIDSDEKQLIDSPEFQRLRNVHQLAMTYLVYPGATHTRFEHSLGVMELSSRMFDIITDAQAVPSQLHFLFPEIFREEQRLYWRKVLRAAALCHDLGHLPFSHAAEKELLPEGWSHETITVEIIRSASLDALFRKMTPPLRATDVAKLAVGQKKLPREKFSDWETILAEIIVGDAFGADRMDYLLRDSHHAGVVYGRFDHYRLTDTLRILPPPQYPNSTSKEPTLGMEQGGLQSAEALALARYFMYSQVYCHPVRRVYDIHLKDFLAQWLEGGRFKVSLADFLALTDTEVITEMRLAVRDSKRQGHEAAKNILGHKHFRIVYQRNPIDVGKHSRATQLIVDAVFASFGKENVRYDIYHPKGKPLDFPVQQRDGSVVSSLSLSAVLKDVPGVMCEYIYAREDVAVEVTKWIESNKKTILEEALAKEKETE